MNLSTKISSNPFYQSKLYALYLIFNLIIYSTLVFLFWRFIHKFIDQYFLYITLAIFFTIKLFLSFVFCCFPFHPYFISFIRILFLSSVFFFFHPHFVSFIRILFLSSVFCFSHPYFVSFIRILFLSYVLFFHPYFIC